MQIWVFASKYTNKKVKVCETVLTYTQKVLRKNVSSKTYRIDAKSRDTVPLSLSKSRDTVPLSLSKYSKAFTLIAEPELAFLI